MVHADPRGNHVLLTKWMLGSPLYTLNVSKLSHSLVSQYVLFFCNALYINQLHPLHLSYNNALNTSLYVCTLSSHVVKWNGVQDSWEGRVKVSRSSNTTQMGRVSGVGLLQGFTTAVNNPLMNEGVSPSHSIVLLGYKERVWKAHPFTANISSLPY